jgi:hypothetical protein
MESLKSFYLIFILIGLFCGVFILSQSSELFLIKEFLHAISAFVVLFVLYINVIDSNELKQFLNIFQKQVLLSAAIISLFGLIKLYFQMQGVKFQLLEIAGYPDGTSLVVDRSFFTLFIFYSIIFIIYDLKNKKKTIPSIFYQNILLILTIVILFSTSRRGMIIATIIPLVIILIWILSFVLKNSIFINIRNNTIIYLSSILIIIILFYYFIFFIPPLKRNELIVKSNFSKYEVQEFVNSFMVSSGSIFNGRIKYSMVDEKIWQTNIDPKVPYSGWAAGNFEPVINFTGPNAEILPRNIIGAKIDKKVTGYNRDGNTYYVSTLFKDSIKPRKKYTSAIYCFVSEDFNGDWVRLKNYGQLKGITTDYYDYNRKGYWQHLQTSFELDSGEFYSALSFTKMNASTFNDLKGFVIYAYPTLNEVSFNPNVPITWANTKFETIFPLPGKNSNILPIESQGFVFDKSAIINKENVIYANSKIFDITKPIDGARHLITFYAYVNEDFNGDEVYLRALGKHSGLGMSKLSLKEKGKWQKLYISILPEDTVKIIFGFKKNKKNILDSLKGEVIFAYPEVKIIKIDPKEPLSWTSIKYNEVEFLSGKNNEIIPNGTKGLKLDKYSGFSFSNYSKRYTIYNSLGRYKIEKGKNYKTTVYCYASEDFDGVRLKLGAWGKYYGLSTSLYNLEKKGEWQKLEINNFGDSSYVEPFLFFELPNGVNYNMLNGYVIFAYPKVEIVTVVSKKLSIVVKKLQEDKNKTYMTTIFPNSLIQFTGENHNRDSINYSIVFQKEMEKDHFSGPRIDRWRYAIYLYKNESTFIQKIFGSGFGYTKKFAKEFNVENGYDYPHNPFLSVLLYSGIFGLIIYLLVLGRAFYLYWLYRKEYLTLFLCFLATFFYSFFSGNNPFDPPVMGLFLVLPFFIHYVHQKDKNGTGGEKINELENKG